MNEIKTVTYDLETTGLDPWNDKIILISYRFNGMGPVTTIKYSEGENVPSDLIVALRDSGVTKRGHNVKFDSLFLMARDIRVNGPLDDTRIIWYLKDPFDNVGLKSLVETKLKRKVVRLEDLIVKAKKKELEAMEGLVYIQLKSSKKPIRMVDLIPYNQADVTNCDDLSTAGIRSEWYKNVEQPLTRILFDSEVRGIKVDSNQLVELRDEYGNRLEVLRNDMALKFGKLINPNSPKQIKEAIHEKGFKEVTETDEVTLKRLLWQGHNDFRPLLEYRKLNKLYNTYVCPLLEKSDDYGRIHGSFNQAGSEENSGGTKTGRLTSSDPNLQNIPARTEEGKRIRRVFIPTPGFIMIDSDLKQIEPRLVAHYTQSPKLIKAFAEGLDTHGLMACGIFGKEKVEELTKMERFIGKTGWLATVYGCWFKKLRTIVDKNSDEKVPYDDDFYKEFQERFWRDNPEIEQWRRWHIESTRRIGYIKTIGGRVVNIPGLNAHNEWERKEAERMAVNYLIQGSAADIMKMAIVKIAGLAPFVYGNAHLLATVHDEVLIELKDIDQETNGITTQLITESMTSVVKLKNVSLEADTKIIANWGDK